MALTSFQFRGIVEALTQVIRFDYPTDAVMSRFFRANRKLGAKDRFIIGETVYATLRRYNYLEAVIAPQEATAKHLAIASLLKVRGHRFRDIADYLSESDKQFAEDIKTRKPELGLAAKAELPQWVIDKLAWADEDVLALGQSLQQNAPLDLRVNTFKAKPQKVLDALAEEGIEASLTSYSPIGIRLKEKFQLQKHRLYTEGEVEIQDEGSQLLGLMLGAKRGEMVVDFCAGAGGKTLLLASAMANKGRLYAFDVAEKRLNNLSPRLKRSGISNIYTILINNEVDSRVKRLYGKVDRVLVDAPCSGMGTLRRNPDLKFRQSPTSVKELNVKQTAILASAAKLLKPGGRLVYATCSLLEEENEAIVAQFLEANEDFSVLPANEALSNKIEVEMGDYLKLYPHIHHTDGFFAAALVKKSEEKTK